jgi:hypothetical protein
MHERLIVTATGYTAPDSWPCQIVQVDRRDSEYRLTFKCASRKLRKEEWQLVQDVLVLKHHEVLYGA